ncbi:DUF5009 domain-containing protein [Mucilaginibacter sp. BJC16-A38]|uniref:DUF5009 domain-containing protein n=1 Tax=Mucilaginibacter phenanthrenivorans TaxID=1234842 RepID=UPI00215809CB|nr:DUF5009 domain-containing protein [Mucilaginibacter phenanthrenivorans]MCR8560711.1 DUF5009 domain-containing protein [Mucilaginibacter phenanthrenivorans]
MFQIKRLHSIDVLRAINMFFMIFVNDLSGVSHVPKWIDHVKANEDGMHFADTVFPLFLFIAGLSIPLAIGRRIDKGNSFKSIAVYILLRSFALIVMGFFHVNMEDYSKEALLPLPVWELLLTISFFLIWLDYPETMAKTKRYVLMGIGIVTLIVLGILYKGNAEEGGTRWLDPAWWGILGLIGWAYLVCAGIYLLVKGNFTGLVIALVLLVAINLIVHGRVFHLRIPIIKDGSCASLMMFGVVVSLLYAKIIAKGSYKWLWQVFTVAGIALIGLGFFVRPYTQGISKIHSTPAWIFICAGIGILLFELLIWLVDVKGKESWFKIIKPAGTSTLTCYLIPYLMVGFFSLINFNYPDFFNTGAGGIFRSIAIAFITIFITGFLERRRLRLKI